MGLLNFETLPEDVLIKILFYKLKFKWPERSDNSMGTLLNISHTNRVLRRFALSTPCLWSTLGTIVIWLLKNPRKNEDEDSKWKARRARDEIEEVILFSEALLSRRKYSKNFRFYGEFENFHHCIKNVLCPMVDGPYDDFYIKKLFKISSR